MSTGTVNVVASTTPVLRARSRSGVLPIVLNVTSFSGSTPDSLSRRLDKKDSPDVSEATPQDFAFHFLHRTDLGPRHQRKQRPVVIDHYQFDGKPAHSGIKCSTGKYDVVQIPGYQRRHRQGRRNVD